MDNDEQNLVARASQGDTNAFEALVRLHERYVFNLALRVVRDYDEAADLAQQAFIRAWHALPDFRGEARFRTWLYRIVTNVCLSRIPHMRRELAALEMNEEALFLSEEGSQPEQHLLDTHLRASIQQAFAELPEGYRLLVTLRHLQGMSYEEIAQVTDLPLGTVKTGIFRARRLLRLALEGEVTHG